MTDYRSFLVTGLAGDASRMSRARDLALQGHVPVPATRDPRLVGLVDCLWWADGDGSDKSEPEPETKLPTGRGQLVIDCGRAPEVSAVLMGPTSRPTVIDSPGSTRAAGIAFTARGLRPFFRERSSELCDAQVSLDGLWGDGTSSAVDEVVGLDGPAAIDRMERELLARLDPGANRGEVVLAEQWIRAGAPIGRVTSALRTDRRRLARHFLADVGFGLKQYGRICRFSRTVELLRAPAPLPLATIAAEMGFADQAHLSREVRHFSGLTPGHLHGRASASPNHVTGDEIFKT